MAGAYVNVEDFTDYNIFVRCGYQSPPKGNRGTRKRRIRYQDIVCAFDIETTLIDSIEQSVMYIWQFQIDDYYTVIGRTWEQFLNFCANIRDLLPDRGYRVVTYIHNASYEFQFLSGVYDFAPDEVFCLESRRIAKFEMFEALEFRCSYIQTNMSLQAFTHKMGVTDAKLTGFDYDKKRYFYTDLSEDEIAYCINDVKGLVQAIKVEMHNDNDDLYSIPLTSTGYVRRDFKKAMKEVSRYRIFPLLPTWHVYELLREAFRGGNTHANRYEAGCILHNVKSADRSSSYPEVQCNHKFPITGFSFIKNKSVADIERIIYKRGKAVIMRVSLSNVRLKNQYWGAPYLSKAKCREVNAGIYDNGRILEADYLETTITDIDYDILKYEYNFDMEVIEAAVASYGKLPEPMTRTIIDYYKRKTDLKNMPGQDYFYMKNKNKLNSVYGCTAQDPVKDSVIYDDGEYIDVDEDPQNLLEKTNRTAFIPYSWGVWCTAWARWELEEGIKLAHTDKARFVYCDTDSVKYIGEIDWSEYNNNKVEISTKNGALAADPNGDIHYMGVYEYEGEYKEFKTLGAKKYAYTYDDGVAHITVAGVPKKKGAEELNAAGGLSAFKEGMIFHAGKLMSKYNDKHYGEWVTEDGIEILITRNVALLPTEYRLGITAEYSELLQSSIYHKAVDILGKTGIF